MERAQHGLRGERAGHLLERSREIQTPRGQFWRMVQGWVGDWKQPLPRDPKLDTSVAVTCFPSNWLPGWNDL